MTFAEASKDLQNTGLTLLKVKDIKSKEDIIQNESALSMMLKTITWYGCKDLALEIKNYFRSIGIDEEFLNECCCGYMEESYIFDEYNNLKRHNFVY